MIRKTLSSSIQRTDICTACNGVGSDYGGCSCGSCSGSGSADASTCPGCCSPINHYSLRLSVDGTVQCPSCYVKFQPVRSYARDAATTLVNASAVAKRLADREKRQLIDEVELVMATCYKRSGLTVDQLDDDEADEAVNKAFTYIHDFTQSRINAQTQVNAAISQINSTPQRHEDFMTTSEAVTGEIITPAALKLKLPERSARGLAAETQWLSMAQSAKHLHVSPAQLRSWFHEGRLEGVRTQRTLHGHVRLSAADIDWVRTCLLDQVATQAKRLRLSQRFAKWLGLPHMHRYLELRAEIMWAQAIRKTVEVSQQRCECGCERRVVRLPMAVGKRTIQIEQVPPGTWQIDEGDELRQIAA